MDKKSFYLLLSSMAVSALAACGDEEETPECPHTVLHAEEDREVAVAGLCEVMAPLTGSPFGVRYGVVGKHCADLCDDQKMNVCLVHHDYAAEFEVLNPDAEAARKCPAWDEPTIPITCKYEEQRGEWHDGCSIAGRRPTGLLAARRREHDTVADFLARAAHLEAASVVAFHRLAEDLARLGAPAALIDACRQAACEETQHAAVMAGLARARGACPPGVDVLARCDESPLELALSNMVEGVVREAYGALQASVGARKARDAEVRAALVGIAEDEASHAWLALRVAAWLDTRLSAEERAQVACAKRAAISELTAELEREPAAALREAVGLPSRAEARLLLAQLEHNVWDAQLAA